MKRGSGKLFSILLTCATCQAQKPEEILNRWADESPIEKVYLQLDRPNYLAGETAWFKAYLYSDFLPDTISTTLYVELLNESSVILSRKILPVFLGSTNGQIELPDSIKTGSYIIRAYSPTMLNQDAGFIYKKNIIVYGKMNNNVKEENPEKKAVRLEFFPEGGNLVSGFGNTIAFKATNEYGLPVAINAHVQDGKNEWLGSLHEIHDGMGMFDLIPVPGEKYYVVLDGDSTAHPYNLPEQVNQGIALTILPHPQGNYFDIQQHTSDPAFQAAYMVGQLQHRVVFRQEFPDKGEIHGVINTKNLSSGILQITFFNKEGLPLAERLVFVNNKEYIQPAQLIADTIDFSAKAKNRFTLVFKDTVQGSFSASISDAGFDWLPAREENIYSSLLLTDDLKGTIHNPAWYFAGDNDSVKNALDLVMMTNGWRRFTWHELPGKASTALTYKDPAYITLAGKINLQYSKKPFADKQLIVFIAAGDSSKSMQMLHTDKEGNFRLDSLLFFGNTRILFSDIRGKKSQSIQVRLSNDSLNRSFWLPPPERSLFTLNDPILASQPSKLAYDYDAILRANGLMLQGVTLKVRKKNRVEELENKYASGLFSGLSEKTIDLVNTNETVTERNIFEYLKSRVPGLNIMQDGPDYSIYYRQFGAVSSRGMIPMTLFLNEIETDAGFISSIPASEVAMVKVFSSFVGATGNGAGGVLAVYTKKGSDRYDSPSLPDKINYNGYSITREFYSPDYTVDKTANTKTDHRITLEWLPNIFVNGINIKLPVVFYNNDRTKQFKIVVEGMTTAGKMVFIEKTISAPSLRPF